MATVQAPEVVAHRVQVVVQLFTLLVGEDIGGEVEGVTFGGEVDGFGDLFGTEERLPLVRETFEMDDQKLRASINLHLLQSVLVLFASRTVPLVVPG